jgi:hypothetical protein
MPEGLVKMTVPSLIAEAGRMTVFSFFRRAVEHAKGVRASGSSALEIWSRRNRDHATLTARKRARLNGFVFVLEPVAPVSLPTSVALGGTGVFGKSYLDPNNVDSPRKSADRRGRLPRDAIPGAEVCVLVPHVLGWNVRISRLGQVRRLNLGPCEILGEESLLPNKSKGLRLFFCTVIKKSSGSSL